MSRGQSRALASSLVFVVVGAALVLAGGFVSAAGGEAPSRHLSWASAYLVLVCGSGQVFVGGGEFLLVGRSLPGPRQCPVRRLQPWQRRRARRDAVGADRGAVHGEPVLLVSLGLFAWATKRPLLSAGWRRSSTGPGS